LSLRSVVTRRWVKTDLGSLIESLVDILPTSQKATERVRRKHLEGIRRVTRESLRGQWSHARKTRNGSLDSDT